MHARIAHIEASLRKLARARDVVRRAEHDRVVAALEKLERHARDLDIQFQRIAQIQAELDEIKRAWQRIKSTA